MAARYSRLVRRRGPNKAAVATAHSILIAVHHMLSTGEVYRDLGAEFYDKRTDPDRKTRHHLAELEAAGHTVNQPIRRASRRERACQYVEISVVAVPLKKKKT